jgi:hypothetical protein
MSLARRFLVPLLLLSWTGFCSSSISVSISSSFGWLA